MTLFTLSEKFIKYFISFNMKKFTSIGTHNGTFHCDEVLGCALLKIIIPKAKIIRSRDPDKLSSCDIVIDVGGVYDHEKNRYDHHQLGFDHSLSTLIPGKKSTIKLSSAGLVYCHFGKKIIKALAKNVNDDDLEMIYDRVYENFIQEIDAIDNGIPICDGDPKYHISTNLSARVSRLNMQWNQEKFDEENAFKEAMELASKEFKERVENYVNCWLPARNIVLDAINNRFNVHESGEVIELSKFCPWKGHFFDLEKALNIIPEIKYCLFSDSGGNWRVQGVSLDENSFILRLPLLEAWRGRQNPELEEMSGIEGIMFVHATGFIGGNKTRDGALEMAVHTLESNKKN